MPELVQRAAQTVSQIFEKAVDSGRIKLEDLFDDKYQPISNTKPPKYKTRYDDFTDQNVSPTQEQLLEQNKWVLPLPATRRVMFRRTIGNSHSR